MSMKKVLFPGTFDPITLGHTEIIERSLELFDEIIIGVGVNSSKQTMFSLEQRIFWIQEYFLKLSHKVKVIPFEGLTVEFAKKHGIQFLLRGLRSAPDFEYEKHIFLLNKHLDEKIETVFLISDTQYIGVSSTLVREIIKYQGKLEGLVPQNIINSIYKNIYSKS